MKEGKKGSYTRCSPYAEVEAERSDCYSEVVRRAAEQFDLSPRKGKILSLFRPNGAAVMDKELQVRGKKVPWTLGNYMLATKRSPAQTKLGIGYLPVTAFHPSLHSVSGI